MNKQYRILCLLTALLLILSLISSSSKAETPLQPTNIIQQTSTQSEIENVQVTPEEEETYDDGALGIIKVLSSERYEGRLIGSKGNELAGNYIAGFFKKIGLKSPEGMDDYKQTFVTDTVILNDEPKLMMLDKSGKSVKDYKNGLNYTIRYLSSKTDNFDVKSQIYVLNSMDDMKADKVKDRAVLVPYEISKQTGSGQIMIDGCSAGASFVIIESMVYGSDSIYSSLPDRGIAGVGRMNKGNSVPLIFADNNTFKDMVDLSRENDEMEFKYNAKSENGKKVSNIVGLIEGTDEKLKKECIIIGAHFDHVGSNYNGTYNPGALDNASGTAAMMEIAQEIKSKGISTKRSIVFIAFNGEEVGGLGSSFYVRDPVYSIRSSTIMINLDMVGSAAVTRLSISEAGELSSQMMNDAKEMGINAKIEEVGGSDNLIFAQEGAQAVMLINDDMKNGYHSPNDTLEDVDENNINKIVNLVVNYIDKLDN
jgi:hypothetical protein